MVAMIVALVLQAQDPTLDQRIADLAKGDPEARKAILRMGPVAIRPLQKARDKAPEKVDELVFDLKKAAAYPADSTVHESLAEKLDFKGKGAFVDLVKSFQKKFHHPLVLDRFEAKDLKSEEIAIDGVATVRDVFDQMCRQAGLDYGFFHNMIIIGKHDRLWPEKGPRAFGPPAIERQHQSPDDEKWIKQMRTIKMDLDFQDQTMADSFNYVSEFTGLKFEPRADSAEKITIAVRGARLFDMVCVLTQVNDFDFMFEDGKIVVDTRDAVAKKLAGKK